MRRRRPVGRATRPLTASEREALRAVHTGVECMLGRWWDELEAGGVRDALREVVRRIMLRLDGAGE
jgi:hypothetical protein